MSIKKTCKFALAGIISNSGEKVDPSRATKPK